MKQKFFTIILLSALILIVFSGCFKKETMPQTKNNIKKQPIATSTKTQKEKATTTEKINTSDWSA